MSVKPPVFKAPVPSEGLIVKWSAGVGHKWFPAIVTKTGGNAIDVSVFPVETNRTTPHDSVRHAADPQFPRLLDQKGGIWDFTDEYKLLIGIAQLLLPDSAGYMCLPSNLLKSLRPTLNGLVYIPGQDDAAEA
jgi:hypothetical protein